MKVTFNSLNLSFLKNYISVIAPTQNPPPIFRWGTPLHQLCGDNFSQELLIYLQYHINCTWYIFSLVSHHLSFFNHNIYILIILSSQCHTSILKWKDCILQGHNNLIVYKVYHNNPHLFRVLTTKHVIS